MVYLIYRSSKRLGKCRFCPQRTSVVIAPQGVLLDRSPVHVCPTCRDTKWKQAELGKLFGVKVDGVLSVIEEPIIPREEQLRPQRGVSIRHLKDKSRIFGDLYQWVAEPKKDGIRALAYFTKDDIRFLSARLSKRTGFYRDLSDRVAHLRGAYPELEGTVLDGELILEKESAMMTKDVAKGSLNITVAILNAGVQKSLEFQKQHGALRYYLFDCLKFKGRDLRAEPLRARLKILARIMKLLYGPYVIDVFEMPRRRCRTLNELKQFFDKVMAEGDEGLMLKNLNGVYYAPSVGARSKDWVKWKQMVTYDGFITGFKPGERGHADLVGALLISGYTKEGKIREFAAVGNIPLLEMKRMTVLKEGKPTLRRDYYGKVVEIRGQCLTKNRRLRHAQLIHWRLDKSPRECEAP